MFAQHLLDSSLRSRRVGAERARLRERAVLHIQKRARQRLVD
jgi:hypothetical protein